VLAFDLMDTLVRDPYVEAYEAASGLPWPVFRRLRPPGAYSALERGEISEDEYWHRHRASGIPVDSARFHRVRRRGYRWLPGMRELLADVCAREHVLVLTNYPRWVRDVDATLLRGLDLSVCASYQVGARKPEMEFFERAARRYRVDVARLVLVDNSRLNVDGARRLGIRAFLFEGADRLRRELDLARGEDTT
jgi:HAD superfamily hydrolase (TIGR01509 family)